MDKIKEIEGMARDCGKLCDNFGSAKCVNQDCKDCVRAIDVAETLYGKGYRNLGVAYPIIDDEAINDTANLNESLKMVCDRLGELIEKTDEVRKEKDDMIHFDERLEIANNASKKTAEKILQKLYDDCFKVNTHIKKVYDSRLPLVGFCDDDIYREIKKLAEEYGVKVGGNGRAEG